MIGRGDAKDYYAILQVDPRAEPEVIEAAYRRLSRKYHPDVSEEPEAARRMRDLNEAYQVLGDAASRGAYDRRRPWAEGPGAAGRPITRIWDSLLQRPPLWLRPPVLVALSATVFASLILRRLQRR